MVIGAIAAITAMNTAVSAMQTTQRITRQIGVAVPHQQPSQLTWTDADERAYQHYLVDLMFDHKDAADVASKIRKG